MSVVTRARLMLAANSSWLGVAVRDSDSNAPTMPSTVPSNPSNGAIDPITPTASVERYSLEVWSSPASSIAFLISKAPNADFWYRVSPAPMIRVK